MMQSAQRERRVAVPASLRASAVLVVWAFGAYAMPAAAQQDALQGTFVNERQADAQITAAIEAAVAKMSFVARPIARNRLKKTTAAHRRVQIDRTAEQISISLDGNTPVVMPADGRAVKWTRADGEVFDVSAKTGPGRIEQSFQAEDGQRTNTYTLAADGTLHMEVVLRSERLAEPVRYVLTFQRQ